MRERALSPCPTDALKHDAHILVQALEVEA